MASSSSMIPVSPPLQPSIGEGLGTPSAAPAASTEAMVDALVAPPAVSGKATPAAPPSVSDETVDLREGFVFPLIDPWYESSPLFPPRALAFPFPVEDWDWIVLGLEPAVDQAWDAGVHWSILISKSCNMFRDTEPLREVLRRWCPSTHTFFFSWGELIPTLEDMANHWMLPILGEHSLSNIKLSAEDEETAAALRKQSSTRLSGWPSFFVHHKDASVRRAAFVLYWLFSYLFAAKDKSAAWGRFSDLTWEFLDRFPDFRDNLPLVYRWAIWDDYPGFTCASVFKRFYQPISLIRDLKIDDYRSLSYLSTVNPGFLPILSTTGVSFIPYCPQRVQRQFGLDQGKTSRVMIPSGHKLDFNTSAMNAYWQRFTQSMAEFVNAGRGDKTPMSVHHKPLVSNPYLAPPSQSAISYANSQKLGFAEWDEVRGGWVAYTIHLPESWRNSVNVVEDRLIMLSKRGKRSKRDAPVDLAVEKTSKKPTPSTPSSKKAHFEKAKAGKKGKSTLLVLSAAKESATAFVEGPTESTVAPPKKTKAGKKGKSTPLVSSAAKESTTAFVEGPTESAIAHSEPKSVSASPSKKPSKKSVAFRPPKGQKKTSISSSSPDEEQPSAVSTPSPSKKKKFVAPLFPFGAAGRTRSKSGSKATRGSGRSGGGVVIVKDSDVAADDVIASPLGKDASQTAAMDQDEDLRKSAADSSEIGAESTGEGHSSSSDSFFDSAPDSVPEEQIMSVGSTADDDDMPGADDSRIGPVDPMEDDLAIVPHASHGRDDDNTVDADIDPISFSVPQTVLTSRVTGPNASIAHIMEGVSLFGATPSFRAIPAGGFVISASHLTSEAPSVASGAFIPEEIRVQGLIESESVVDLGVSTANHSAQVEDTGVSAADMLAGSDHLENIGMDDTVHMSEDTSEVGITGEITAVSPPPRPTVEAGSSVGVGSLSSEVADFLKEFDRKAPNPHPEQYFWCFNGPLVPFEHQCLFGKSISDDIKALQHQIALLQDSLAKLTAYQDEMVSTGRMVLRHERGRSFLDSLLD
uniref:Aminotransferase-like plant mobile domain-containing protein n=1 Tax=Fagus sylvatica TaxID=28930 RepID=A0A2N9FRX1_FAGSY